MGPTALNQVAGTEPSLGSGNPDRVILIDEGRLILEANKYVRIVRLVQMGNQNTTAGADCLFGALDFAANTATTLHGIDTAIIGIGSGCVSGDLLVLPETLGGLLTQASSVASA